MTWCNDTWCNGTWCDVHVVSGEVAAPEILAVTLPITSTLPIAGTIMLEQELGLPIRQVLEAEVAQ